MADREYFSRYEMPESSEYFPQYKSRPVNPAYSFYAPAEGMSWYGKQAEPVSHASCDCAASVCVCEFASCV